MISATESSKVTDNNYNNLDLYIPRISALTTEDKIKQLFWQLYIGHVEYADIVATKHPDTKEVLWYSAFVRLKYWGPALNVGDIFQNLKTYKMELNGYGSDSGERFWWLFPNKTPLPRTKVNVSQLAASTDKLFEQQEAMAAEIKELKELTVNQSAIIESLQFKLLMEKEVTDARLEDMMHLIHQLQFQSQARVAEPAFIDEPVPEVVNNNDCNLALPPPPPLTRQNAAFYDYVEPPPLTRTVRICEEFAPMTPPPALKRTMTSGLAAPPALSRTKSVAESEDLIISDEDDCLFSRPLRRETIYSQSTDMAERLNCSSRNSSAFSSSNNSPISFEDSKRAEISRDFCGNY
jgi:hypothetical protein